MAFGFWLSVCNTCLPQQTCRIADVSIRVICQWLLPCKLLMDWPCVLAFCLFGCHARSELNTESLEVIIKLPTGDEERKAVTTEGFQNSVGKGMFGDKYLVCFISNQDKKSQARIEVGDLLSLHWSFSCKPCTRQSYSKSLQPSSLALLRFLS